MELGDTAPRQALVPWFAAGLRFHCTSCGKCCSGASGSVYLSQPDLERLAAFFRSPVGTFARKYTRVSKGRRVLMDGPGSRDCIFLRDGRCNVYDARPIQCRTYPWWKQNIATEEAWHETAVTCEGINHPAAILVSTEEILDQADLDRDNEVGLT